MWGLRLESGNIFQFNAFATCYVNYVNLQFAIFFVPEFNVSMKIRKKLKNGFYFCNEPGKTHNVF